MSNFIENRSAIINRYHQKLFVHDLWHDWLKTEVSEIANSYDVTVMKCKKILKRRPVWATTFKERDLGYRPSSELNKNISEKTSLKYFEEEEFKKADKPGFSVVRLLNPRKSCRRIYLLQQDNDGNCHLRQEDWVSKREWKVTRDVSLSENESDQYTNLRLSHNVIDTLLLMGLN